MQFPVYKVPKQWVARLEGTPWWYCFILTLFLIATVDEKMQTYRGVFIYIFWLPLLHVCICEMNPKKKISLK